MTKPRFYLDAPLTLGAITLPKAVAQHIRALRLQSGDEIALFNGAGGQYQAKLGLEHTAEITGFETTERELLYPITLVQGLIASNKMDWVIEKAVELGAAQLIPLQAARSVTKLDAERAEKRLAHWRGIVTAASEQCGRNTLMTITEPMSLAQAQKACAGKPSVLLQPQAAQSLSQYLHSNASQAKQGLSLWVGPEGGWDAKEQNAIANQAITVQFGARVLRTETAGAAVLAAIQAIWTE